MDILLADVAIVEQVFPVLVRHGHVLRDNPSRERTSMAEWRPTIRREGIVAMSKVSYALLDEDRRVGVIHRSVLPA